MMSKGTTEEKIMWSFDFLDLDRNGFIEKQEMLKVKLSKPIGLWLSLVPLKLPCSSCDLFDWEWPIVVATIKVMNYFLPESQPIKVFISFYEFVFLQVMEAVYEMVLTGNNISHTEIIEQVGQAQLLSPHSIILHNVLQADCQFLKMDLDRDGVVSKQEFVHYCCNDSTVLQSMCVLP